MIKKYSLKFWIIFWLVSAIVLSGWYFFLQLKKSGIETITSVVDFLPADPEAKEEYKTLISLADYLLKKDSKEKVFLVLFQNNLEIRPGGGFIGSFGILKIKDGSVSEFGIHDTGNFDGRIPNEVEAPYPIKETLHVNFWKLRDSNFSPDFPINAKKAEEFYYLGQGEEKFDGIIGITANVLTSFLKATGPIELEGFPGTYKDKDAIVALEYQVEKAFEEQGISRGERKSIMNVLGEKILKKVFTLSNSQKFELAKIILEDLHKKDIQIYSKNNILQEKIQKANWGGEMDQNWNQDYLLLIDANLGAFKSDYYIKRSFDYQIDLTGEKPKAVLKITYKHTATQKDFMTKDYLSYLRVYVPEGAWLDQSENFDNPKFGKEFRKTYFGSIIKVPLNSEKTVTLEYSLPKEIENDYNLKIQKQAGINDVPVVVHIIDAQGKKDFNYTLNSDLAL
ncbi:MAG: hypothetical protein COU40_01270 [Candidatus Moranbacteria bacterium CG10_big_fil_rev_8_21_14_0_10_35_21]|nr:MAG: hypothetical protein COU40_01270 [Candidatus Moranbacteria bacterium CG10_big_fil_rev_8_21_14_0_10_35_21]PJA88396.1 MAG: hypothetical protein CO139_03385 [Candidatus Moranbacteria bacterium CG_4_9_14_3_um_filter_36_9]